MFPNLIGQVSLGPRKVQFYRFLFYFFEYLPTKHFKSKYVCTSWREKVFSVYCYKTLQLFGCTYTDLLEGEKLFAPLWPLYLYFTRRTPKTMQYGHIKICCYNKAKQNCKNFWIPIGDCLQNIIVLNEISFSSFKSLPKWSFYVKNVFLS